MMNKIFHYDMGRWMMVYVDDVIIYSKTAEEHLQHIRQILEKLRKHGLYIKPKKCKFTETEISYLGHIINQDGIHTDSLKIQAVAAYPRPMTVTEAQAFMRLASYYRRFI